MCLLKMIGQAPQNSYQDSNQVSNGLSNATLQNGLAEAQKRRQSCANCGAEGLRSQQVIQVTTTTVLNGSSQASKNFLNGAGYGAEGLGSQGNNPASDETSAGGLADIPKKVLNAAGHVAEGVHWGAEELISASGLGPIFEIFDKPIIHNLLWSPIARLTGAPVDSHPPGIK